MGLLPRDRDLNRALETLELEVDASHFRESAKGFTIRLDHFLAAHLTWRSRSSIQELIKSGAIQLDASSPDHPRGSGSYVEERRPGRKLRQGSQVTIVIPEESRLAIPDEDPGPLEVLFEDKDCLAVDKPPGVPVHPSGRHFVGTLIQRVHHHFRQEIEAGELTPRLCHRLDRETSGIVLVAKRARTHPELSRQFEEREVEKEYLATVWGELERDEGSIELPIAQSAASTIRLKMTVREDGLPCRTDYRVVDRVPGYSLLRLRLFTGRQHQIRVHLAAIGYPIVGDKLYGPDEQLFQRAADGELDGEDLRLLELPRQALHNHRLVFRSPASGEWVEVVSPLAADLDQHLEARR